MAGDVLFREAFYQPRSLSELGDSRVSSVGLRGFGVKGVYRGYIGIMENGNCCLGFGVV